MTTVEVDHVKELEQEVKNLSRLVREMAARERVMTARLQMVARESADSKKQIRELTVTAKKIDGRISQVQQQKR